MTADALRSWLREHASVDVSDLTCKTWLSKEWSSDAALRSVYDIEDSTGDLLRTASYMDCFSDEASAGVLADQLIEGQPPVYTTGHLLRQWYQKYHPAAGPKRIASAVELEDFMGDDLRSKYQGIAKKLLILLGVVILLTLALRLVSPSRMASTSMSFPIRS